MSASTTTERGDLHSRLPDPNSFFPGLGAQRALGDARAAREKAEADRDAAVRRAREDAAIGRTRAEAAEQVAAAEADRDQARADAARAGESARLSQQEAARAQAEAEAARAETQRVVPGQAGVLLPLDAAPKPSNSPACAPARNARHSAGVNPGTGPDGSLLCRTPTLPSGRSATSMQAPLVSTKPHGRRP